MKDSTLQDLFSSPNVPDSNLEPANLVDVVDSLSRSTRTIAGALCASDSRGGHDVAGGYVTCVSSALMGVTSGLFEIAAAVDRLAIAQETRG